MKQTQLFAAICEPISVVNKDNAVVAYVSMPTNEYSAWKNIELHQSLFDELKEAIEIGVNSWQDSGRDPSTALYNLLCALNTR